MGKKAVSREATSTEDGGDEGATANARKGQLKKSTPAQGLAPY